MLRSWAVFHTVRAYVNGVLITVPSIYSASNVSATLARLREALSGAYAIERELGRGGMATVYLAHDLRHDRDVALKVLSPEMVSGISSQRFLREIRTVARLNHPHILPMHDSGEAGGFSYYTMPYADGESLRARLKRERALSVDDAIDVAVQIADALAYAHAHGVVHRDIKPENVLFSATGHLWVADFGLARAVSSAVNDSLTESGFAVGSPRYVSPEQAAGERHVDGRSDVYSLACVTYEMLTGAPPFPGDSLQALIAQHVAKPAPHATTARAEVSARVSDAVAKAMSKDPDARFATAAEFAAALNPGARPESYARPFALPLRMRLRRTSRFTRIAGALAAVVIGAAGVVTSRDDFPPAHRGSAGVELRQHRVIVTPLENRTGSSEYDQIGLMVADWSATGLRALSGLEVVPTPTAVQAYRFVSGDSPGSRAARDPVRSVATETGAGIVVTGAVYRRGDRVLFRLQVTDVGQSRVVETLSDVEAPVTDPLAGVEEVRERLMGWFAGQSDERIRVEMSEHARPPTYNAYVAFSEGLDRYIEAEFESALPYFLRAYEADSSFVASLLYASLCSSNLGAFAQSDSLLTIVSRDKAALSQYDRAWLDYRVAFLAGNFESALKSVRVAAMLAPDSKAAYNHAVTAYQTGRPTEALRVLDSIPPERGPMRGFLSYWGLLAAVHHTLGHYDAEMTVGSTERRLYPGRLFAFFPVVRSLAVRGRGDSLDLVMDQAETFPADQIGLSFGDLLVEAAEELGAHGHSDVSVRFFERAYAWHSRASNPWRMSRVAYALRRYRDASDLLAPLRASDPDNVEYLGMHGLVRARLGEREEAMRIARSLSRLRRPFQFGTVPLYQARIAAVLGDRSEAVAYLRQAFDQGKLYHLWLHRDMDLDSLRGYAPFEALVRPK